MEVLRRFSDPYSGKTANPEDLRSLGDKAAALYRDQGIKLSDAVIQVIGERPLNNNHVQRVIEFANIAAFKHAYRSEPGPERIVDFEGGPASAEDVLGRIRAPSTKTAAAREEAEMAHGAITSLPAELVGLVHDCLTGEKLAAAEGPVNWASILRRLDDEISSKQARLALLEEKLACELHHLCTHVRRGLIDGNITLGDVSFVVGSVAPNRPEMVKRAMDELLRILGPQLGMDITMTSESLGKHASSGMRVNDAHPFPRAAASYIKIADELEEAKHAEILLRGARARLRGEIVRLCAPRRN